MSGSNDIETRKEIFRWIAENEKVFYMPREPMKPIGVYFSAKTRNYFADSFIRSFQGMMYLMLQAHLEFEVVTPRTLEAFKGDILILPDVKCISDAEIATLSSYVEENKALIITGESGKYDETGQKNKINKIQKMLEITDTRKNNPSGKDDKLIYYPVCPGKKYWEYCRRAYNHYAWTGKIEESPFIRTKDDFINDLKIQFGYQPEIMIKASHFISSQITQVESIPYIFLANFKGLKSDEVATQIPEHDIEIGFPVSPNAKIYYLPFLGDKIQLDYREENNRLICTLPPLEKGGVVWRQ